MRYCVVKDCKSHKQQENPNIKFFKFPRDAERKKIWIDACGKKNVNYRTGTICSLHFTDNDWRLKDKLLNNPIKKRLLNGKANPTQHIFSSNLSRERRTTRCLKKSTRKIAKDILKDNNQRIAKRTNTEFVEEPFHIEANNLGNEKEIIHIKEEKITNASVGVQTEIEIECAREFKIMELEKQLKSSQKEIKLLKKELIELTNLETCVSKIFSKGQIMRLKNPEKNLKWSMDDISAAVCLHSAGPKAYKLLYEKNFPLPRTSTLSRWAGHLNVEYVLE